MQAESLRPASLRDETTGVTVGTTPREEEEEEATPAREAPRDEVTALTEAAFTTGSARAAEEPTGWERAGGSQDLSAGGERGWMEEGPGVRTGTELYVS